MTDNMTPELTLEPNPAAAAETVPQLTLTPEAPEPPKVEEKKAEPVEMDDKLLSDEEKKAVEEFSHKINIRDTRRRASRAFLRARSTTSAARTSARWARI